MTSVPAPTSVIIADDDRAFRAALAEVLRAEPDFVLAGEAADGHEAMRLTRRHEPELVLVDVRMEHGGPELVRALMGLAHPPRVVGLSGSSGTATWTSMLAAGACGYLLKGAIAVDLPCLLRRCAAGELIVTAPGAADVLRRRLISADGARAFSPRAVPGQA